MRNDGKLFVYEVTASGRIDGHGSVGHGWEKLRSIIGATTVDSQGAIWAIDQDGVLWEYSQQPETSGDRIVEIAKTYLGIPYVRAGQDRNGMDCSGLVSLVYRDAGKPFRVWWRQDTLGIFEQSRIIPQQDARPGDILYWSHPGRHVAIYIGNGLMIDAAEPGTVTAIRNIYRNPTYLRYDG